MASVSSLDKDLRNLRLSKYTPQAAAEVQEWVEEVLHEKLPAGDLLDALKDGVALCKLVNLVVSPGLKYKQSSMPFVQMENISNFLRACQIPPLSLPPHDVFLTVDLYEAKDPLQVLQCMAAFSRRANALNPVRFPRTIGPKSKGSSSLNTQSTGSSQGGYTSPGSHGGTSTFSGPSTPTKSAKVPVSTWSRREDEHTTQPAWNILQYGYMGGANQQNQGVAFGTPRQITTALPYVPTLQEKEKRRREESEKQRLQAEQAEWSRQKEREEEEERAKADEERKWEEETTRMRNEETAHMKEQERRAMAEERKQWAEEQRRWEEEEERQRAEEREVEERMEHERQSRRGASDARLNGQFLSQYRANQTITPAGGEPSSNESKERQRIIELERELELAKQREREYYNQRQEVREKENKKNGISSPNLRKPVPPKPSYDLSSLEQERRLLRTEWEKNQDVETPASKTSRPLPDPTASSSSSVSAGPRPLPKRPLPSQVSDDWDSVPSRRPQQDQTVNARENRVDRFLSSNPPPPGPKPATYRPQDYSTTAEVDAENNRRIESQQKTRAGGWASKSLLEREMERERERQREWEEGQKQVKEAAEKGYKDPTLGETAWNVHPFGYFGGDNQNRVGPGLGIGGRRQIVGPRPQGL